jgi:RNA recognition motif-containing protein
MRTCSKASLDVILLLQYNCSDSRVVRGDDGRCLGYGFVTIRTQEDANAACTAMDGQRLMGRPLRVSLARTARHSENNKEGGGGAESKSSNRAPDPPASTDVVTVARQVCVPSSHCIAYHLM